MYYRIDKLKKSAPSRIVNVSSIAHKWCGQLDLTNLNSEKYHDPKYSYAASKLALVVYTRELSKRLAGTGAYDVISLTSWFSFVIHFVLLIYHVPYR